MVLVVMVPGVSAPDTEAGEATAPKLPAVPFRMMRFIIPGIINEPDSESE